MIAELDESRIVDQTNLGEKRRPDRFNIWDASGLDQRVEFISLFQSLPSAFVLLESMLVSGSAKKWDESYSDIQAVISKDEGSVGSSEFGGRHFS